MSHILFPGLVKILRNPRIPLTLRKKIGKRARLPRGVAFSAPLFGLTYTGRTGNHIDNKVYLYGGHETATLRLMRHILRQQRARGVTTVLVDIGTNAGVHLLASAPYCDRVHGFEPWERVRCVAQHNIERNALAGVTIHDVGLSDGDEDLPFLEPAGDNLGVGAFVSGTDAEREMIQKLAEKNVDQAVMLRVRRGDDVMAEHGIVPTLIKIDTEGFERRILAGLRGTIAAARPAVVFEYSTVSRLDFDPPGALAALFGPGYRFYGLRPSREHPALEPFRPGRRYENLLAWPEQGHPLAGYRPL